MVSESELLSMADILKRHARSLSFKYRVPDADLLQEGWVGCIQAAKTFRHGAGMAWRNWAWQYSHTLMMRFAMREIQRREPTLSIDFQYSDSDKGFDCPDWRIIRRISAEVDYSGLEQNQRSPSLRQMRVRRLMSDGRKNVSADISLTKRRELMRRLRAKRYLLEEQARYPFPTSLERHTA